MGEIEFIKVEREWGIKCSRDTIWREGGRGRVEILRLKMDGTDEVKRSKDINEV